MFNNSAQFMNCSTNDNVMIYDENRALILDYCQSTFNKKVLIASKYTKNLIIEYNYGGKGFFWTFNSGAPNFY